MSAPVLIGLTGSIGAGKSAAAAAFARAGAAVFSADAAVHRLYEDPDVVAAVRSRWGDRVVPHGSVDRARIADIVFSDPKERQWLESLLHPLVAREWLRFVEQQRQREDPPPAIVAEVPLLFEAGLEDRYDCTVAIIAPLELRLARVGERAQGASHAASRAALHVDDDERRRRADVCYVNDGTLEQLEEFAASTLASLAPGAR